MKPGDHPEFFRFAPPPGTSRESTLRLHKDGRFSHDGESVEPRALEKALHRWIARHPDDGRFILTNGYDWCYFAVDGTPFLVRSVVDRPPQERGAPAHRREPGAPPLLELDDESAEPLDPASLRLDADGALVARVKGGQFDARFTQSAQRELAPWLVDGADGEMPRVAVGDATYAIAAQT